MTGARNVAEGLAAEIGDGILRLDLATPETLGTSQLWLGIAILKPGSRTTAHALDGIEALHFTLDGQGREIVNGEAFDTSPGVCVHIPAGAPHQVVNTGSEDLRIMSITSPPIPPLD